MFAAVHLPREALPSHTPLPGHSAEAPSPSNTPSPSSVATDGLDQVPKSWGLRFALTR